MEPVMRDPETGKNGKDDLLLTLVLLVLVFLAVLLLANLVGAINVL